MKFFTLFVFGFLVISLNAQEITKPNVIIIYADDLGWQDTELNNEGALTPWETPNLLSLASEGANFTQAYSSAPTCAPSRAAMMSGRHPISTKMTHVSGGQIPEANSNNKTNKLLHPYYPGRLHVDEITIAEALSSQGYVSGHIGKWHMAAHHNTFPEAIDQGFYFQFTGRGITTKMDDRSKDFATDAEDDPYKIDEDGRPYDEVTENALAFLEENKSEPFFMYMATWLVHTPIQTRDLALLTYYSNKLGIPLPTDPGDITTPGQTNPYYGAMVGTLDWSVGKIVEYLKNTDDPRHPGKKLFETTYIIFSSDNGGAEKSGQEIITDNFPLDLGKKHAQEGGIRVPMVITGPNVLTNTYDNTVSHLDFFPTILSWTEASVNTTVSNDFDGVDLSDLLEGKSAIAVDASGNERKDLFWHYPHGEDEDMQSALRSGSYKVYKNHFDNSYEIYQLYNTDGSLLDLEENTNIYDALDNQIKNELVTKLETFLTNKGANYGNWNPDYSGADFPLENQTIVTEVTSVNYDDVTKVATMTVNTTNKANVQKASLLYRESEIGEDEEWFEAVATVNGNTITADVPESAKEFIFTIVDENNFLIKSEKVSTVPITYLYLDNETSEESFEGSEYFSELIGNSTVNNNYIQSRTRGGGDGVKYLVKTSGNYTVECDNISFWIRSLTGDTLNLKITVDGQEKTYEYTSVNDTDDIYLDFDIPTSFSQESKEIEVLITDLQNVDENTQPRFRLYGLTFEKSKVILGLDNVAEKKEVKLVQNPVKSVLNLSREVNYTEIYNILGKKQQKINNQYKNINVSSLKSGLYFLKINYDDNLTKTMKFIKNN